MSSPAQNAFAVSDNIYLLNHSIGRIPISTESVVREQFYAPWQSSDENIWTHWLDAIAQFRAALAALFNAEANDFCPQSNLSSGLTKFVQSLSPHAGRHKILMTEGDFPSAGFVLQQAQANGFELKTLPTDGDVQAADTWAEAMSDDVHCVFITHVHYATSTRVEVEEICRMARERGILSIVDIAQSAGVVPIDFHAWQADVVVGSCIKWLCGGPGAGFIWLRPGLAETMHPVDVGWFSHRDPFEFDINHFEYAPDSARFWGGTPSVLPYIIAANSILLMHEIGIEAIQRHNQTLLQQLLLRLDPETIISPSAQQPRGGTLVVDPARRDAVEAQLRDASVQFDARALGIRLSPHIYNTAAEIEQVADCFDVSGS